MLLSGLLFRKIWKVSGMMWTLEAGVSTKVYILDQSHTNSSASTRDKPHLKKNNQEDFQKQIVMWQKDIL